MVKVLASIFLLICLAGSANAEKQVAITIDDLPFQYGRFLPESIEGEKFRAVLAAFHKHHIQVFGFVISSRIDTRRSELLNEFKAGGHIIANHTFTHPDLNTTTADWYINDILKGDSAIAKWVDGVKYFRYPYLHQGPTQAKYDSVAEFLRKGSYVNVPVSIDDDDWLFNKHYTAALNDKDSVKADSIGEAYLIHMSEKTNLFDSVAVAMLGRDIKHILLIHMNEINADYLDRLLSWYEEQGWHIITPQEALTDSLYKMRDTYIGTNGTSWLLRF
jgi:peptidoglycan-N-acetylglucosamine deacetylase